jgi:peptide chain release factor subunit 1
MNDTNQGATMPTELQSTLETLTALPTTEHPFVSAYIDWRPDGNGERLALRGLDEQFDQIAARLKESGANLTSFNADRERINEFIDREAPVDACSLAIFACNAEGIFQTLALQVPVETKIVADHYPHVFDLARIADDYETYALVLADGQESRILVITLNEAMQVAKTSSDEEVNRTQVGGWSQNRYQRHIDKIIKAHTKDINNRLERIIKRYDVQHVIIAANDSIKGFVMDNLSPQVKERLVDYINLDIEGNLTSILASIEPMMRDVEREQEADDLTYLEEQARGNLLGVDGVAATANALTKGQVEVLIMHQNFNAAGGECPNCGAIRSGLRPTCPFDGAEMQQVDLREIFTSRALQQGSKVQIVEESVYLDEHEGVGAILRWRESDGQERTA